MKDIRFRGKRADNGEWVYGCFAEFVNYLDGDTKPGIQVTNQVPSGFDRMIPAFETELVEVIPETIGQYTGLKDRNDVEIYEGDIVYIKGEDNKGAIAWDSEELEYGVDMEDVQVKMGCFYGRDFEVIGNIHDNPELMDTEP